MGMPPLRPPLRRLFTLSAREWTDAVRAEWHLLVSAVRMRTARTGALMNRWQVDDASSHTAVADPARAREIGHWVRRMAHYGPLRAACLTRSLAICRFLAADDLAGAIIRIGVRPKGTKLEAHAWVEYAGEIIGDSEDHVRQFAALTGTQPIPGGALWT